MLQKQKQCIYCFNFKIYRLFYYLTSEKSFMILLYSNFLTCFLLCFTDLVFRCKKMYLILVYVNILHYFLCCFYLWIKNIRDFMSLLLSLIKDKTKKEMYVIFISIIIILFWIDFDFDCKKIYHLFYELPIWKRQRLWIDKSAKIYIIWLLWNIIANYSKKEQKILQHFIFIFLSNIQILGC